LPVYSLLMRRAQHLGLALASSLGLAVYTIVLFIFLNRRTHNRGASGLLLFFGKVAVGSVATGWACYRLRLWLEPHFAWQQFSGAFLLLVVVTSTGIVLLLLLAKLLRIREMDEQISRLWRLAAGTWRRAAA
jgi:peptidoglycan biosynthesis protein MviN/MurJ (putative lipid II flippase)